MAPPPENKMLQVHPVMGDQETVIQLDGVKGEKYKSNGAENGARVGSALQISSEHDQEANGVENPSSGSSLTVRSRTTASAASRRSNLEVKLPWYAGCSWRDIRDIIPSLLILFIGIGIMILIIPYAFASVIKQLQMEEEIARRREEILRNKTLAEAANE